MNTIRSRPENTPLLRPLVSAFRSCTKCLGGALIIGTTLLATDATAGGRPNDPSRDWWGLFSGGVATPSGSVVDTGWNVGGGAMYWPQEWPMGLLMDVNYSDFTFSRETLDTINDIIGSDPNNDGEVSGGGVTNLQFGLSGIWGPGKTASGLYFTAGVSANYMEAKIAQRGLIYYPPYCDPWYWWWCSPGGWVPGDVVTGKESDTHFGYNAGVGWNIETPNGQLYFEATYENIETGEGSIGFIPITFGVRF